MAQEEVTKQLLGVKRSGHLVCPESEVDHYLKETYSDECKEQDLGPCQALSRNLMGRSPAERRSREW